MPIRRFILLLLIAVAAALALVVFSTIAQSAVAECFAAVVATTLVLVPIQASLRQWQQRTILAGAVVLALSIFLLLMLPVTIAQCLACIAVIASHAILVSGLSWFGRGPGSAVVITALLLWLAWPIWLSGRLAGHDVAVDHLAAAHPLLTINGQLLDQAIWTERPFMYGWTGLNQDVPFSIPTSIWPCVLLNGLIGSALLATRQFVCRPARILPG